MTHQPDHDRSVLDHINTMNWLANRMSRDMQSMREEVNDLASMFGINVRPEETRNTQDENIGRPDDYRQDVPYFMRKSDPLFARREVIGVNPIEVTGANQEPRRLEINPNEPDGMPRADRS